MLYPLAAMAVLVVAAAWLFLKAPWAACFPLLVLAGLAWLYALMLRLFRRHLTYGCANPAVVVATEPECRIAVGTDLTMGYGDPWPVVRVLPAPCLARVMRGLRVGQRLATISTYNPPAHPDDDHWSGFNPLIVPCVTADAAALQRVMATLGDDEFRRLEKQLTQLPNRTSPGMYRVNPQE